MSFYDDVYEQVKRIPTGKVATYKQIAVLAGRPRASRIVGGALHNNPEPSMIPCHRVIFSTGKLTDGYAFGGIGVQAEMLKSEGIEVVDNKVSLQVYQM